MRLVWAIATILLVVPISPDGQIAAGIHIAAVRYTGDTRLDGVDLASCAADVKTGRFTGPTWEAQAASYVKTVCLQDNGYFMARVTSAAKQLADADNTHQFEITFDLEAGPQYRTGDVRFSGNRAIATTELRALVPLQPGEIFRARSVRDGIALMHKAYKARGYPDWTPIPDFSVDNKNRLITIIIDMQEGKHVE